MIVVIVVVVVMINVTGLLISCRFRTDSVNFHLRIVVQYPTANGTIRRTTVHSEEKKSSVLNTTDKNILKTKIQDHKEARNLLRVG
jgi:hypothetical protein